MSLLEEYYKLRKGSKTRYEDFLNQLSDRVTSRELFTSR